MLGRMAWSTLKQSCVKQAQKAVGEALAAGKVPASWQIHKATGGKLGITRQVKQQVWGPIQEASRNGAVARTPSCGRYHTQILLAPRQIMGAIPLSAGGWGAGS